jgi:hypothetical protein
VLQVVVDGERDIVEIQPFTVAPQRRRSNAAGMSWGDSA